MANPLVAALDDGSLAPRERYPGLFKAGDMLLNYGTVLRWLAILAAIGAAVLFGFGMASDKPLEAQGHYSLAFSALGYVVLSIFASVLARGIGEAAFALGDMATSAERTADAITRASQ